MYNTLPIWYSLYILDIYFNSKKIQLLCNSEKKANKELGTKCTKALQKRLAELFAVRVLGDFKFGNPHPLKGKRKEQFSVGLYGGYRLVFEAVEPIPKTNDDTIDWEKVEQITIIFIGDYHE